MYTTFFPAIFNRHVGLKEAFGEHNISFGMAGEHDVFTDRNLPIMLPNCHEFTSEVSLKMEFTQPEENLWNFSYFDELSEDCKEYGLDLHGHCTIWHMQIPDWLSGALAKDAYSVLYKHIDKTLSHCIGLCKSIDILNEYEPAYAADLSWAHYLGLDGGIEAMKYASSKQSGIELYYNSFFRWDSDVDYALKILPYCDGIGFQLHVGTWEDLSPIFERVDCLSQACKSSGKKLRFSEISVMTKTDMTDVAKTYRKITRKAIEAGVSSFTTWGVYGTSWNGGYLLFDKERRPILAYYEIIKECLS